MRSGLRPDTRRSTLSPRVTKMLSFAKMMERPPGRGAMSMRSRPGTAADSYQVSTTIVSAGVRRVVFCVKVSVWYHVLWYLSCIARTTWSPDVNDCAAARPGDAASTHSAASAAANEEEQRAVIRTPFIRGVLKGQTPYGRSRD